MYDAVAETIRVEGTRILATLIRTVGDVQLAEDAVQEATLAALGAWPVTGVPPEPRAWLTVTARRKAIDIIRRERARPGKERDGLELMELSQSDGIVPDSVVQDDPLASIAPSTSAHLAQAVATGEADGTASGLAMLDELPPSPRWHAVRAELLARDHRYAEAAAELTQALAGPATDPERAHRERRRRAFLSQARPD